MLCVACRRPSDTVDAFNDLALPIPQNEQLRASIAATRVAQDLREGTRRNNNANDNNTPFAASGDNDDDDDDDGDDDGDDDDVSRTMNDSGASTTDNDDASQRSWLSTLTSWLAPTPRAALTLMDCLYAFFLTDELQGDNRYFCQHCRARCDAEKSYYLLTTPDILCLNLKRFRSDDAVASKIGEHVQFPLVGLSLERFYPERDIASPLLLPPSDAAYCSRPGGALPSSPTPTSAVASKTRQDGDVADGDDDNSDDDDNDDNDDDDDDSERDAQRGAMGVRYPRPSSETSYSLIAVVVHIGSLGGGHYVAYARRGTQWFLFDDATVQAVDVETVLKASV